MNTPANRIQLLPAQSRESSVCGTESSRLEDALASRPDVRAAEIGIEAATERAGWERSRVSTLIGILDGNSEGREGAEFGPGIGVEVPVLSHNQGAIGRADVEIERASHHTPPSGRRS